MSVCLFVYITRKPHGQTSPDLPMILSVFLRRDTLYRPTSGFVDDITFSHTGPVARYVYSLRAIEYEQHNN